jgi:hypothetical protein
VPVAVADLDIDLAGVGPGSEQHGRLLATALPAVRRRGDAKRAGRPMWRCDGSAMSWSVVPSPRIAAAHQPIK